MTGAVQEDKRIRRTKKLLRQALTRLMQQKDFQSITVTDVVREADINRGTFYAHYRDVYDLREKIEAEMIEDFRELIADLHPSGTSDLQPVLARAVDYLEENREIVRALVRGTGVEGFGRKMITVLEECHLEMRPFRSVEDAYAGAFSRDRHRRHDGKVDHRAAAHPEKRDRRAHQPCADGQSDITMQNKAPGRFSAGGKFISNFIRSGA